MPAKPNYQYEKRQREVAKQKKKLEKAQRKTTQTPANESENPDSTVSPESTESPKSSD